MQHINNILLCLSLYICEIQVTLCAGTRLTRTVSRSSCETESPSQTIELMRSTICMWTFWLCPLLKEKHHSKHKNWPKIRCTRQSKWSARWEASSMGQRKQKHFKVFPFTHESRVLQCPAHRGHFRLSEHQWLSWIAPICSLYSTHAMKGFHLGFARIIVIWPNAGK